MAVKIIFGFSDESGEYKINANDKHIKRSPYYVRGTLLINAEDWKELYNRFNYIKIKKYRFPDEEIKWSYLWSIKKYEEKGFKVNPAKDCFLLRNFKYNDLLNYVEETLAILNTISSTEVILTVTKNKADNRFGLDRLYEMHIRSLLQRVEMGLNGETNGFATLFFDPINNEVNEQLRDTYQKIYKSGDFIKDYKHLKDSLNIEFSHHSVGIQMADFISGCFVASLKGYPKSIEMFNKNILPNIRKYKENILGAGILEVPKSEVVRKEIKEIINKNIY